MVNELDRLTDLREMVGVSTDTLYGWRLRAVGPAGYSTPKPTIARGDVAHIERRGLR